MRNYLRIVLFSSIIGLLTSVTYHLLRSGMSDNSFLDSYKILGFLFFILSTSTLVYEWASRKGRSSYLYHPSAAVIVILLILSLLSFVGLDLFLIWPISVIGWLQFGFFLFKFFNGSSWVERWVGIPIAVMAGLTNAAYIYSNLAKPHLFEALVAQHLPFNWPTDTLFHSSIVQMINSYGVPSIGVNGIEFMKYHFGSHFFFNQISNIIHTDPIKFYTLACPVIFSSLFFFVFFHTIIQVNKFLNTSKGLVNFGYLFWILFFGLFFGFLKRGFIWHNGLQNMISGIVGNSSIMVSESYLLSIILCFVLFTILLVRQTGENRPTKDYFFYLVLCPLFLVVVTIIKVSTGFILFAVLLYLFIRYSQYKNVLANVSLILGTVGWFLGYKLVTEPGSEDGSITFEFFRVNNISFIVGFLVLHYLWTYILIGFYFVRDFVKSVTLFKEEALTNILVKLNPLSTFLSSIKRKDTIFGEVAIVVALAGLAPTVALSLDVNGAFFSEVQFYFSIVILLGYFSTYDSSNFTNRFSPRGKKWIVFISFLVCCYVYLANTKHWINDMADANLLFRKTIVGDYSYTKPRIEMRKRLQAGDFAALDTMLTFYGKNVQTKLDASKEYRMLKELRALDNLSLKEKRMSMIYIDYRHAGLHLYIPCYDVAMMAPALSGLTELNGLYGDCKYPAGWRFENYKWLTKDEAEKVLSDVEICALVKQKGFAQVFVYKPSENSFVKLTCNQ